MRPVEAIKTCLAKSFQFSGRASRSEFWWFAPVMMAVTLWVFFSEWLVILLARPLGVLGGIVLLLVVVPWPLYMALARRLRDAGLMGWLAMLMPSYFLAAPPIALWVDASQQFGISAPTRGMPELGYALIGSFFLALNLLLAALRPTYKQPTSARSR